MPKRSRRLKKGIESITKSIEKHVEKKAEAMKAGNEYLVEYFEKEINRMIEDRKKMKEIVDKKRKPTAPRK